MTLKRTFIKGLKKNKKFPTRLHNYDINASLCESLTYEDIQGRDDKHKGDVRKWGMITSKLQWQDETDR